MSMACEDQTVSTSNTHIKWRKRDGCDVEGEAWRFLEVSHGDLDDPPNAPAERMRMVMVWWTLAG